ncbi:APC family permease [Sneathiella aquimaris]|uniref:APC family permease n=1 Tax=Sneathiella aquimaris TaxID=2599305 RepID=UPI00146D4230|nr:APC family permease [Sneathiella aquimaris]
MNSNPRTRPQLVRRLTLPLLILYGLGVTVGAGIYVLVGTTAERAGIYAPISFILAAITVAFTGLAYSELSSRYPVSAGEAAYVQKGFNSKTLSLIIGLLVIASGTVSASAISIGAAAYLENFIPIAPSILTFIVVISIGLVAIWGILESVLLAAVLTVIELAGLGLVVIYGLYDEPTMLTRIPDLIPPFDPSVWGGILSACLLAFFAFIGFEDMVNVAEEVKNPKKTMPRGILLTLLSASVIYFLVVSVVVLTVPLDQLSQSAAPLQLVFHDSGEFISVLFGVIAIFATLNGILIQIIMASRVIYGLATQEKLPAFLAQVNSITHTPLKATILVCGIVLLLTYTLPIGKLAEATSSIVIIVFCLVNVALIKIKISEKTKPVDLYQVSILVPILGLFTSLFLLLAQFWL